MVSHGQGQNSFAILPETWILIFALLPRLLIVRNPSETPQKEERGERAQKRSTVEGNLRQRFKVNRFKAR